MFTKKARLFLFISALAVINLHGMNSQTQLLLSHDIHTQKLQELYTCAQQNARDTHAANTSHWNSPGIYTFHGQKALKTFYGYTKKHPVVSDVYPLAIVEIPCRPVVWYATMTAYYATDTKLSIEEATTHIVAAIQKCQRLAGQTVEDEHTIHVNIVTPWLKVNSVWAATGQPFYIQKTFEHG